MKLRDDFDARLRQGSIGEKMVARLLMARGCGVVASYDFSGEDGQKVPKMVFSSNGLVIPDLDVCGPSGRFWVEVKSYSGPAMNRRHSALVHGYSARLHRDYCRVASASGSDVLLVVIEIDSGDVLLLNVMEAEAWPCMCRPCSDGRGDSCVVRPKAAVYFDRSLFRRIHVFGDGELEELRAARDALAGRQDEASAVSPATMPHGVVRA